MGPVGVSLLRTYNDPNPSPPPVMPPSVDLGQGDLYKPLPNMSPAAQRPWACVITQMWSNYTQTHTLSNTL